MLRALRACKDLKHVRTGSGQQDRFAIRLALSAGTDASCNDVVTDRCRMIRVHPDSGGSVGHNQRLGRSGFARLDTPPDAHQKARIAESL